MNIQHVIIAVSYNHSLSLLLLLNGRSRFQYFNDHFMYNRITAKSNIQNIFQIKILLGFGDLLAFKKDKGISSCTEQIYLIYMPVNTTISNGIFQSFGYVQFCVVRKETPLIKKIFPSNEYNLPNKKCNDEFISIDSYRFYVF